MNAPRHKHLQRLLDRHLNTDQLNDLGLGAFIEALDRAFHTLEKDKHITEHAFEVSEKEYQEVLRKMERENREKRRSVEQLETALHGLVSDATGSGAPTADLSRSLDLLREVIQRGKLPR